MHVGIVGAGAAASAAAYALDERTDARVTVLEKSGGVCGRAATRRKDSVTYDYGANYLKDENERVTELVTDSLDEAGLGTIDEPIYVFDADGEVAEGRESTARKFTYERGLTQVAKRLFDRTEATVHRRTRVERLAHEDGVWRATDDEGETWGPFDVLLCNPPAPQTAQLLRDADWESPARERIAEAAESIPYRTIWTAVLGYEFELDVPYYALVNPEKDHEIGWISREECKPGHVPDGQSVLIVQANHDWSRDHYDDPPEENVEALASMTAEILGDERLGSPAWTDHQGWRYALPLEGVPADVARSGEADTFHVLGDWIPGDPRLHAALETGLSVGERVADSA
jgi:predicted NAD/FAD-dependent oxidoreductase